MKIGQPPGSSGLSNSQAVTGNSSNYNMGGSGPVKAAHHSRNCMGGRNGSLEDQRNSPHNFNANGTGLTPQEQDVRNSPPSVKNKINRSSNSGSPTSNFMASGQSNYTNQQTEKSSNHNR